MNGAGWTIGNANDLSITSPNKSIIRFISQSSKRTEGRWLRKAWLEKEKKNNVDENEPLSPEANDEYGITHDMR